VSDVEPGPLVAEDMTVVACRGGGGTRLETRPLPRPGPGELLLTLRYCGLCGTDLFKLAHATETDGTVLGHEIVGTVASLGAGVDRFAVGDRVVSPHHVACGDCELCRRGSGTQCAAFRDNLLEPGGFAEVVLVRARAVERAAWRVPDHVSDAAAVFLEPAACVLRGVRKAELAETGSVLVIGGGSMGLLHLVLLRARHPGLKVVVSDPQADRQALALELGAEAVCGTSADELSATTATASRGLGVDAVFDTVGGAAPLRRGLGLMRPGGACVLFAHAGEGERADFELNSVLKTEKRVVATYSGTVDEQREVAELLSSGRFDPSALVSHRLPLSAFDRAVELARDLEALKIVLYPEGG
jgi:L-iditol 2-dehydrogenase